MHKNTRSNSTTLTKKRLTTIELSGSNDSKKRSVQKSLGRAAVVGLGYVGLPLAILMEQKGYEVVGIDIDRQKITSLRKRQTNVLTEQEQSMFSQSDIHFGFSPSLLRSVGVVVICVPTPVHNNHTPDLGPLRAAAQAVGENLDQDSLVIVESTVNPGVCEEVVIPTIELYSGLQVGKDFFFAHCPERINPGDDKYTVANIPRVVGGATAESSKRAIDFYRSILDVEPVNTDNIKEAESVKMVENAFRDINIAYVNELAMSFDRLGIDIQKVIEAASSKPFAFMAHYPGCGVGGHCIPVDPYYLINYAAQNGFSHTFLKAARRINSRMPLYTIQRLESALKETKRDLSTARVALLGLAYKRDIADCRESPALAIQKLLVERGATVITYDPFVLESSTYRTLQDTLAAADTVVIATDHTEFKNLGPSHFKEHNISAVVDGRNCLSKDQFTNTGIVYRGIGR